MCIFIERNHYKELAHVIMEAETPRDLLLASWRPQILNCVQRLEDWESQWKFESKSQQQAQAPRRAVALGWVCNQQKTDVPAQGRSAQEGILSYFCEVSVFFFFFLFRLSTDLTRATHIKAGNPFYSVSYWFKCEFHPKYPHRYTENNAWPSIWTLCGSVKLTCKVNDH